MTLILTAQCCCLLHQSLFVVVPWLWLDCLLVGWRTMSSIDADHARLHPGSNVLRCGAGDVIARVYRCYPSGALHVSSRTIRRGSHVKWGDSSVGNVSVDRSADRPDYHGSPSPEVDAADDEAHLQHHHKRHQYVIDTRRVGGGVGRLLVGGPSWIWRRVWRVVTGCNMSQKMKIAKHFPHNSVHSFMTCSVCEIFCLYDLLYTRRIVLRH